MSLGIGQTASSSSSPPPPPRRNTTLFPGRTFDTFLSFRGKDTRRNLTDHLYTALVEKGIRTFRDEEECRRGEIINQNLLQAIEGSRIFIIIFSENYANSKWRLNELVEIMKCRAKGRIVFPIFYHVDPSNARYQCEFYEKAFEDYEEDTKLKREQIQEWRTALTETGNISGIHIQNQYESQEIVKITRDVLHEMISKHCNEDGLVGKEHHLEDLKALIREPKDVLMVGIHGHNGTGKTTIARALYDEISCQFEGASFLANIGDVSEEDDLRCLQKRLFCDILLGANQEIRLFRKENNVMKDKIRHKKVLIILDDVNKMKQLEILAGEHDWFGKGSRIIITTKNEYLLRQHKVDKFYGIKELDTLEALQLFNHHANTNGESLYQFYPLSTKVIKLCGLYPLDLKVVGAFLRGKSYSQWEFHLGNLTNESDREKWAIRVSYDGLKDGEKHLFLDVACFFKGECKDFVTKMLDGHHFSAENGIKVLTDRCLIIDSERKLWMNSIIQELGWQIVRKVDKPCRMLDHMNIRRLLRTKEGIKAIERISLDLTESNQIDFSTEVFAQMTELKLVKVFLGSDWVDGKENYKVKLPPNFEFPCCELRYLHWHGYQLESYPSDFDPVELLELNMPYSCLKQINGNEIHFPKLTTLNLSHSQQLENTSNFSRMPNLERLVLEGCRSLVRVDPSIGDLNKLSLMNLKNCKRLNSLPKSICNLKFLETLILAGCSRLEKLLGVWEERQNSVNLKAIRTYRRVIILPPTLRILHLGHCKRFQEILKLPSSIQEVDAYNCISMGTLSWNTRLGGSILQRIKINPESPFSIVLPGKTIPEVTQINPESPFSIVLPGNIPEVTHKVTGSSVTLKLKNPDRYNDDFLGFAVCLVFAPQAERPQLNPEILCELNNFTFFYCCGEDSVESDQERGNNSADHVWLAYRPHARADGCHPEEWKASFKVTDGEVKEWKICIVLKTRPPNWQVVELVQPLTGETAHSSLENEPWLWLFSQGP